MKKIVATLGCFVVAALLLTSCLDDETEYELTAYASITSFSINDIETVVTATTSEGTDTTYTTTVTGSDYLFTIDHLAGEVYNRDSLPVGTDVTKVTVNLGFEGYYAVRGEGDEAVAYSSTDSIDFSSPVRFTIYATDGTSARPYYIRLNVHQTEADSLMWQRVENTTFPGEKMQQQKALTKGGRLYVFAQSEEGLLVASTLLTDGVQWTDAVVAEGLQGEADCRSAVVLDGRFYLLASGKLYVSEEGTDWVLATDEMDFSDMVAATDNMLYLRSGNKVIAGTPAEGWDTIQTVNTATFPHAPSVVKSVLSSNESITRTVLVGTTESETDSYAKVWVKLSNENVWTYYNDQTYGCPALQHLTVIGYDGRLYAFGGRGLNGNDGLQAFESIYTSTDGGVTWQRQRKVIGLPAELLGFDGYYSCVVDEESNCIWIMCSGSGAVYKGRISRLAE